MNLKEITSQSLSEQARAQVKVLVASASSWLGALPLASKDSDSHSYAE